MTLSTSKSGSGGTTTLRVITAAIARSAVAEAAWLTTSEKLWVDAQTGHLILEWTAYDPVYYTAEHHGTRTLVRTDLAVGRFDCDPDLGHTPTDGVL